MLPVEECEAYHRQTDRRDDLLFLVDRGTDNEVEEVLPRGCEDGAVLRVGDFDDDAPAGVCLATLRKLDVPVEVPCRAFLKFPSPRPAGDGEHRELPVRPGRTVVDPRGGVIELQWCPLEHGGRCGGGRRI